MTSEKRYDKGTLEFISHTRVLAPLPEEELANMCMDMTRERYKKGFILCRQDKTSLEKVYIIENGLQ